MKKWISVLLIISIALFGSSCYLMKNFYTNFPLTTMWVSESPTIGIYLNGSYGDLITKDGEYKTFIIFRETKYQLADADTHETLLDLKDWKFTQNQLILIIAPSDIGQIFDESITEIVLDRKDAEETDFLKIHI